MAQDAVPDPATWLLVDVMNVVGSVPDGWWRDRVGACARLVARLGTLGHPGGVTAVVDGSPTPRLGDGDVGGVTVVHAGRARDAADDAIVALLVASPARRPAVVVTADAALRERVAVSGATTLGPRRLRARLDAGPVTPP